MGAGSGLALKGLQWFIRGVQFLCAGLVLSIYSYYLATLHNHGLPIAEWVRAVEGIAGFACLYTLSALLLLCCVAGHPLSSFLAMVFDVAFAAAFIYVASANHGGSGSCTGTVDTPFGSGNADTNVVDDGHGGFTSLPSLHQACQLETACLAVSVIAIFFFIFSMLMEVALARHRSRERRFGPGPANDYTSGYGKSGGLFGWLRRRRTGHPDNENFLPEHVHPDQLEHRRQSYATETTAVAPEQAPLHHDGTNNKFGENDYALYSQTGVTSAPAHNQRLHEPPPYPLSPSSTVPPRGYNYEDGVYERV